MPRALVHRDFQCHIVLSVLVYADVDLQQQEHNILPAVQGVELRAGQEAGLSRLGRGCLAVGVGPLWRVTSSAHGTPRPLLHSAAAINRPAIASIAVIADQAGAGRLSAQRYKDKGLPG